ncbi:sorbosone dehydrogenase family protein [Aquiflexum sp.]|uniref:PQQ-dependent sugar dehydrogenase n=1 Tax=Aquiflexum sp. TaxID=1872584 RepID=UPI0035940C99
MKKNTLKIESALVGRTRPNQIFILLIAFLISLQGCQYLDQLPNEKKVGSKDHFPLIKLPPGFKISKVADKLDRPTSVTWDDEGKMYIMTAGNDFLPERETIMSIMELKADGTTVEIANLSKHGIQAALVSMIWHKGWFYFTHRAENLTGAVSRVNKEGKIEPVFSGIIDNQAEHQINDIQVGPDGMMYVSVGMAGNAAVMGMDVGPFVMRSPEVKARPCRDIVLTGRNFLGPDFRTEDEDDLVLTGAYVPFGIETSPGQVIKGVKLCGGSILKFDPENCGNTISTYAWGFRNLIGLTWDSHGNMFAAENGYDVRGLRPVKDYMDASLRIHEGKWYGIPDFSANREPLTDSKFEAPESFLAEVFIGGSSIGKGLGFVIDHEASGLTPPDPSVVLGKHEFNSSPSMLDVAPKTWGNWADHVFIAEWGDLAPPTNPLRGEDSPALGYRIVRVDPNSGIVNRFAENIGGGPASKRGMMGKGIERPFDVKFGPDGAMYVVDYGEVQIDFSKAPPYDYQRNTGMVWKITRGQR